jgi:hypothetical protein
MKLVVVVNASVDWVLQKLYTLTWQNTPLLFWAGHVVSYSLYFLCVCLYDSVDIPNDFVVFFEYTLGYSEYAY